METVVNDTQIHLTADNKEYIYTGKFTGRSPKDRFIVLDNETATTVEWNDINQPIDPQLIEKIWDDYVIPNPQPKGVFGEVGGQIFALSTSHDWAVKFFENMTTRLQTPFLQGSWWIIHHYPELECEYTPNPNTSIIDFVNQNIFIFGSGYTGEIKKGMFSVMNFLLPEQNILPMHCSANARTKNGDDVALFFGLSGTGKTTLSSDPNRFFIGDDEHGWRPNNTVFNFEGGCYAKIIDHNPEKEPIIDAALNQPGALFENVVLKDGLIDYTDDSITPNIRVSYPLDNIDESVMVRPEREGGEVKNIFFLSYDAYGVLPPVMKLNPDSAKKYFELGYTSKVAGTEVGVTDPQVVFSPCFGAPFMPRFISEYSDMFYHMVTTHDVNVWMINTGLNGTGKRYDINFTRTILNNIMDGDYTTDEKQDQNVMFGGIIPTTVGSYKLGEELSPSYYWDNKEAYNKNVEILTEKLS